VAQQGIDISVMDSAQAKMLQARIETLKVLVVDDDHYMRKVVRTMLAAIGVRTVFEAPDGISGLDSIRQNSPDLVIVDWEMPMIDGAQFVRMVRSPNEFPIPDIPIIMLSGHGDRWRVSARTNICSSRCPPRRSATASSRSLAGRARPSN
jgi:CheY-like chemotaxis protein